MLSLRLTLLDLAKRQQLPPDAYNALLRLTRNASPRPAVFLYRASVMLAVFLCGLGGIFFIAANWTTHSPIPMFAGLQLVVLGACVAAWRMRRWRAALALLGFLATGALLAFFGQYYQSGADPWQLFAIWAGLGVPLVFACRSDVCWSAWAIVAMTAISTWVQGFSRNGFLLREGEFLEQLLAMALACALCALLSRPLRRLTGAGDWSMNLSVLFAVFLACGCGLGGLLDAEALLYPLSFLVLAIAAGYFGRQAFDIRALSMCALGIDVLIAGGSVRAAIETRSIIAGLLLVGITILVSLYFTVIIIRSLAEQHAQENPQ